jgi:serine/threonine protein kinase
MSYCLNPHCRNPQNPLEGRFCIHCGSRLLLGDRYRAVKRISAGGIGRTFQGIDEGQPGKPYCAIKQVDLSRHSSQSTEQATQTFLKEALKLQELGQHPQIPQLLAYFEPDRTSGSMPTLIQEWIDGKSLEEEGLYGEAEIYQFLHNLLPVLQFVHDRGVIHRDLNPQNLIRPYKARAKAPLFLVDFSTAKVTTKTTLAKAGTAIGSAAYAAPEQLRGQATFASDLYSLGIVCVYLLTQIHPFELHSSMDGISVWPDFLATPVSDRLRAILNKMIAETLGDRYQSAAAVYHDLHAGATLTLSEIASPETPQHALTPQWQCFATLTGHLSSVNALAFHPAGQLLASGGADRTLKLWNTDSNALQDTLSGHRSIVAAIAYSPDGELLVSGSWDYTLRLWQGDVEIQQLSDRSGWVQALAISPDGKILASGGADKTINLRDLASGQLLKTLTGHSEAVCSLAIGVPASFARVKSEGSILASGSSDRTIKIWDLATGEVQQTLIGHEDAVNALVFSPSGQLLISGSTDVTIKIWHPKQGKLLHTLREHSDAVRALAINREGNLLVSGSSDKTVKIWHPGSGKLLHSLSGHEAGVLAVALSPGDRVIASGSQDKTIKLWRFE